MCLRKYGLMICLILQGIFLLSLSSCYADTNVKTDSVSSPKQVSAKYQSINKFLIGIFSPPSWEQTNDEQYKRIRDAHVDYIQTNNSSLQIPGRSYKMLQLAKKYDLKVLIADSRVKESLSGITSMVRDYRKIGSVMGYDVANQIGPKAFDVIAKVCREILKLDKNKITYVNLSSEWFVPNYESDYVNKWIEKAGKENIQYLSFENYPFLENGTFRESYFKNLDIIRRAGLNNGIRTASYLQAIGVKDNYRRPNATELEYNAFINLAYGIKSVVWFTYWSFAAEENKITTSIVDEKGNETDLYEPFKKINGEMQQLGKRLIKLDAIEVYHSGSKIPEGAARIPDTFFWQPENRSDELIVSHLKGVKSNEEYVMVVNKSLTQSQRITFRIAPSVKQISEVSKENGKNVKTNFEAKTGALSEAFLPGEGKLFQIK